MADLFGVDRFAGVIGWQEVNDLPDREKLDNRLGAEYDTFYPADGPAKAIPISLLRHDGDRRVVRGVVDLACDRSSASHAGHRVADE